MEGVSRTEALVLGEGPSGSNHLQLFTLDVGSMNAVRAYVGQRRPDTIPAAPGPSSSISEDALLAVTNREPTPPRYGLGSTLHDTSLPVAFDTAAERLDATVPFDSSPFQGTPDAVLTGPDPDPRATLQVLYPEKSNLPPIQPAFIDTTPDYSEPTGADREPVLLNPDSSAGQLSAITVDVIPFLTPQTAEWSIPTVIKAPTPPAVEDPVIRPIEEHISAFVKNPITVGGETSVDGPTTSAAEDLVTPAVDDLTFASTVRLPTPQFHTPRFSFPPFQRPTLLDTLIQRLQTKRVLVHTWRIADQYLEGQGALPTRHRLENLGPGQISEYIKSGGKSINASSHFMKEKVTIPFPSFRNKLDLPYTGIICLRETIDDCCCTTKKLTTTPSLCARHDSSINRFRMF